MPKPDDLNEAVELRIRLTPAERNALWVMATRRRQTLSAFVLGALDYAVQHRKKDLRGVRWPGHDAPENGPSGPAENEETRELTPRFNRVDAPAADF